MHTVVMTLFSPPSAGWSRTAPAWNAKPKALVRSGLLPRGRGAAGRRAGPGCPQPVLNAAAGAYEWAGIELKPSAGCGLGMFATGALPAGLLLPYGGLEASPARLRWLAKHDKDRYVARTSTGPAAGGVDADPTIAPSRRARLCLARQPAQRGLAQ